MKNTRWSTFTGPGVRPPELLDMINKKITLEQTRKIIINPPGGIKSRASFILGLPSETRAESRKPYASPTGLPLDQVRLSLATPFPGTRLREIAVQEGQIDPRRH